MSYEEEAKELMRKFKLQHQQNMGNPNMGNPNPEVEGVNPELDISNIIGQSPLNSNISEGTEQGLLQDQNNKTQVINIEPPAPTPPPAAVPTGNTCQECKMIHPPLRQGEQCPNKSQDLSKSGLDDSAVNKFIVDIRNMVVSQMDKKGITDGTKFFQFTVMELMKILEEYNE